MVTARSLAVEHAERAGRIGVGDRGAHVLHRQPHRGERDRIDPHADRRLLGAVDADLGDALDLREPLRDHGVGGVVDVALGGMVFEVSARIMIGVAAGLDLRKLGRDGRSVAGR